MTRGISWGASLAALAAAAFASPALAQQGAQSTAQAQATRHYDIASGDLAHALQQFGEQADVNILFDPALVQGKTTRGLHGAYTQDTGIAALLNGCGLHATRQPGDGFAVAAGESPTQAPAHDQQSEATEEIIVTGFRASLANALSVKRSSDLIVESVTAEDIGKMPDQNVAELLQRLPGVQIDRSQGHGTAVLIDGLRQNLTTLNGDLFLTGREFYVSGEGSGGGAGGNSQYASLEGIPSEEIGRVDVFKSPNASLTEGGLGGIVDLRSRDPLAAPDGLTIGGNARGSWTNDNSDATPNATVVATWKASDTFAVTGSFSYDEEHTHTKEFEDYNRSPWITTGSATAPYVGPLTTADQSLLPGGQTYLIPEYAYFSDIFDESKTTGASLGLSWAPSESIRTTLNYFYSKVDDTNTNYSVKIGFNGSGASVPTQIPGIDPSAPFSIDANGIVQSATFQLTGSETATLYQRTNSEANNVQWHTSWDNGSPLTGTFDVAWAHATSNLQAAQADVEHGYYGAFGASTSAAPTAPGCNNFAPNCTTGNHGFEVQWSNGGDSGLPTAANLAPYQDVLTNPNYVLFKSNWAWANLTDQTQEAVRGALMYRPHFLSEADGVLTAGFRWADRDVEQTFGRYLLNGLTTGGAAIANCCSDPNGGSYLYYIDPGYAAIPYSTAVSTPTLAMTVHNFALGDIVVKNPATLSDPAHYLEAVWNNAGVTPAGTATPNNSEKFFTDTLSSFEVHEKTTAAYVMADLGGEGHGYHANLGVRLVDTDLTIDNGQSATVPHFYGSASWNGVNSNNVAVQSSRSYIDVLPSMNLVLDVTDEQKVRLSAARVMAPQDLYSLGVGNSYNFTRETGGRINIHTGVADGFKFATGSSGNPDLDPYRATQFNLAWEDYFAPGALFSIGGFYKQVDNFVETQNLTVTVMDDFGGTAGNVAEPVNAGHGKIYGFEISGQYAFDNGFGFAANYTRSESESDQVTAFTDHATIPGVSKNSFSGTAYYENAGFQARLSYTWRDKAVNDGLGGATFSVPDATGAPKIYGVFSAPYGQVDGQLSYDFTPNIGIVLSGQNLTDEAYHTYLQFTNMPFTYDDSGTRYFLGVRFRN